MSTPVFIITYFLETICNFLIASRALEYKIKNIFRLACYTIFLTVSLIAVETIIKNNTLIPIIQLSIYTATFALFFKQSLLNVFSVYIYTFIISCIMQYIAVLPTIVFPAYHSFEYYPVTALVSITIISVLIYFYIPIERFFKVIVSSDHLIQLLTVNLFLLVLGGSIYYKISNHSFTEIFALFFLLLFCFLTVNVNAIYTRITFSKQQEALHAYEQYQPIVDNLIQDIRMRQHNFDNIIQSFAALPLTCTDYESITEALNTYSSEAFQNNIEVNLLKLNQRLVSGLLYTKMQEAQKQEKILHISIKNYALQTTLPEYLLMECMGILIDNAIEAVPQDSVIYLQLDSQNSQVTVETKNPGPYLSDDLLKKMFEVGYTTKNDTQKKHGLGLPFLQKTIRKYNGTISCYNTTEEGENHITFKVTV